MCCFPQVTMADRASADRACKDPNPIIDGRKANVNLAYLGAKPRVIQPGEGLDHSFDLDQQGGLPNQGHKRPHTLMYTEFIQYQIDESRFKSLFSACLDLLLWSMVVRVVGAVSWSVGFAFSWRVKCFTVWLQTCKNKDKLMFIWIFGWWKLNVDCYVF